MNLGKHDYCWYNRSATALSARVCLKHAKRDRLFDIVQNIKVELMYSDGVTAAPIYQVRDKRREKIILNILSPSRKQLKCSSFEDLEILFRIEEVTFYHGHSRGGFRLKVSVPHFAGTEVVHPFVSEKVIHVLSKKPTEKKEKLISPTPISSAEEYQFTPNDGLMLLEILTDE